MRCTPVRSLRKVSPWDDNGNGRVLCAEAHTHGIAPVRRRHSACHFMTDSDGDGVVSQYAGRHRNSRRPAAFAPHRRLRV